MTKSITKFALLASVAAIAFENKPGWKMDGDKLALDANGNPIYVKADGTEQSVQGDTISRLNGEAKDHRERAERAESAVQAFKDIDPAKAKEAIEKLSKIDQKKLIDAGEVDKVKEAIEKQFTGQLTEAKATNDTLQGKIDAMTLDRAFDRSTFIGERIAVPPEMFSATFGRNFKVEDGKVVPYDASGNKIFSKKHMGEIASVDEALEIIVETYPYKDQILKANGAGGSGGGGGGGNRGGTSRTMRRADFDALAPVDKSAAATAMGKGELSVVD